ncbi:acylphosphatase [Thalassorhabdus alkalitolerans]|uniref:Acylphosphatase n=1 Tax=Thalassorhabdus alkalitolerans TaxID=2282697 RepID=A0ABW0YNI6_9BACI
MKKHIIVHGKVQGVGFRDFTRQEANKKNVFGWVKNNSDGTVELKAEGDNKNMEEFIDSLAEGNSFSKVDHLDINEANEIDHENSFEVKY